VQKLILAPKKGSTKSKVDSMPPTPNNIHVNLTDTSTIFLPKKDSTPSVPKKDFTSTKIELKKPMVIIRKRDTIIDIDTIQTIKRRKRR
jgi:hypothetical protein